jgi:hypothetical protein
VFEFGQRQYCESAFHIGGRGTIILEGPWDPTELVNRLAVTGGTGDLAGVGGIARFEPRGRDLEGSLGNDICEGGPAGSIPASPPARQESKSPSRMRT